jgi:hypothetical protein
VGKETLAVPEVEGAALIFFTIPLSGLGRIYEALELSVIGGFGQIYARLWLTFKHR